MIFLWLSVYSNGNSIEGYTAQDLISYYLLGFIFNRVTNVNIEIEYINQVRSGEIAKFLLKPFSLTRFLMIEEASWRTLNLLLIGIPVIVVVKLFTSLQLVHLSLPEIFVLILLLCIAFIINGLTSMLILAASFFMDQGKTLVHFKWILGGIFSGALLPLSLYPPQIQHLARLLPFQFSFAVPVEFALGNMSIDVLKFSLLVASFWIILLYLSMRVFWRYALKNFTAVGS